MSKDYAALFKKYGAQHYGFNSKEIVIVKARGIFVWDVSGKVYLDVVSGYASNGFGHGHKGITRAITDAVGFGDDGWRTMPGTIPNAVPTVPQIEFLERICTLMGYEKALPMNSGAEAVETAIKLARKWGYRQKKVTESQATILVCDGNFHGRTTTIVGFSSELNYRRDFGPYDGHFEIVPFASRSPLWSGDADLEYLESRLRDPDVVGFLFEPIQGEGGVNIPRPGYLQKARELCTKHNVLMIADEIQTGLGRTGKLLACEHEGVRPDIVILGKLLGAGKVPVSCVLADAKHMVFEPGDHGSTYAGNAFCMSIANAALRILEEDQLWKNSAETGTYLLNSLSNALLPRFSGVIKEIRGRGLMIGIELAPKFDAKKVIDAFFDAGLLAKDAHGVIRITPPLIINERGCTELVRRVESAFRSLVRKKDGCGKKCKKKKSCC